MPTHSLPRLPVPSVAETVTTYLASVEPLLAPADLERTRALATQFLQDPTTARLQQHLTERAGAHANWLRDWWLEGAYLSYRESVLVNVSPGVVFEPSLAGPGTGTALAGRLAANMVHWKQQLDKGRLPGRLCNCG